MFAHNAMALKEKRLLEITPEPLKKGAIPLRTPNGSSIEPGALETLNLLSDLFAA